MLFGAHVSTWKLLGRGSAPKIICKRRLVRLLRVWEWGFSAIDRSYFFKKSSNYPSTMKLHFTSILAVCTILIASINAEHEFTDSNPGLRGHFASVDEPDLPRLLKKDPKKGAMKPPKPPKMMKAAKPPKMKKAAKPPKMKKAAKSPKMMKPPSPPWIITIFIILDISVSEANNML